MTTYQAPTARRAKALRPTDDFTLQDKFLRQDGRIILSGIQALVRLPLDQHNADARQHLSTATLVSGYRGSPLGGIDMTIEQIPDIYRDHHARFLPAVNEDLGATAVFGSQLANTLPGPRYDGVLGMWYGKAPGLDRSSDAIRHANFTGVGRYGGVLALAGDDPSAKSSTLPSHSEVALFDLLLPTLYPGNVQEVLDYGRYGFELSRYSGLWTGFKIVTNVADAFATAEVSSDRVKIVRPDFLYNNRPWQHTQDANLLAPHSVMLEEEIFEGRLEAASIFAHHNHLNQIVSNPRDAVIGIVAAGKTYYEVQEALRLLGMDEDTLDAMGIRLLKLGMIFPIEPRIVREFADGLSEILVIEEKRAFIELFLSRILYPMANRPALAGKRDETGKSLVPSHGSLSVEEIAQVIARRVRAYRTLPDAAIVELARFDQPRPGGTISLQAARKPYFCSGCPHNRSTLLPDGSLASGGIGCHTMVVLMEGRDVIGITQMGGEGANWVGMAPFTETEHIFQNLGDGTLFHSGTLAIRQAVASKANITYKILYNSAVAMTGGQDADGGIPVPQLTRLLEAEGVGRIIVVTPEVDGYPADADWARNSEIWHRDRMTEAQEMLREVPGTTVIIYDQECAANLARKRRRGQAIDPPKRIFINERVCEGCGDCGVKSNCLSVQPVETEFGRKTQIHQASCNKDYTCLEGHCPSFISVITDDSVRPVLPSFEIPASLPEPKSLVGDEANIYMMGIGGTGVVTTNQILGTAALLEGKVVHSLDQTGLSQKGGPVVSHMRIMSDDRPTSGNIPAGQTDCYLVFDVLTAAEEKNLAHATADRSVAVVSTSQVPTGAMVRRTDIDFPSRDYMLKAIDQSTRAEHNIYFDATGIAESLFGSHMPANLIAVGAAWQNGLIPLSADSIARAIRMNGVAVTKNQQAFDVGRALVADPAWAAALPHHRTGNIDVQPVISDDAQRIIESIGAQGDLLEVLQIRVPDLITYHNTAYARHYADTVADVLRAEQAVLPGSHRLAHAVARNLYKLMSYKDEYEVARLHLQPELQDELQRQFGAGAKVRYMLQPPLLSAFGLNRKIALGRWFEPMFGLLVRLRFLRGTPFDVFGYDRVRRTERRLITQYQTLLAEALSTLSAENHGTAVRLASLPDVIRGYDHIKLANVDRFWQQVEALGYSRPQS